MISDGMGFSDLEHRAAIDVDASTLEELEGIKRAQECGRARTRGVGAECGQATGLNTIRPSAKFSFPVSRIGEPKQATRSIIIVIVRFFLIPVSNDLVLRSWEQSVCTTDTYKHSLLFHTAAYPSPGGIFVSGSIFFPICHF